MNFLGTLGSLNVLLSADTAKFSSAMDKAAYIAERDLNKISIKGKITMAAITTAVTAAGTAIAVSIKKTIDHADEIGKMSSSLGMTVEQLSSLEYAAKLADVEIESLRTSFQKFNKAIFEAADGGKEYEEAFRSLGVTVTDTNGNLKSNYDVLLETADAFSRMTDGVQKSAIAQELFGKSGAAMIPLLNSGKDGIKDLAKEAASLGVVLSSTTAEAAERFNDNMTRIASSSQGIFVSLTSGLIPTLANLSDNITRSSTSLQTFHDIGKGISTVIVSIVNTSMVLIDTLKSMVDAIGAAGAAVILMSTFQFKEAMNVMKIYAEDQTNRWNNLAVNLDKNWKSIYDTVKNGSDKMNKSLSDASDKVERFNKKQEEGRTLTESLRTAQEKYNDEMAKYNDLLASGAINQETFDRAAKKAKDTLEKSSETTKEVNSAARDLGFTFQSAFEDAIIEGKKFGDVLSSLMQDMERILLRNMIIKPLADALSSGMDSFFGTASAHGNIFSNGSLVPFASGGLITTPTIFPMANGGVGLAGEAGDEAIMPLFRGSNGDLGVKSAGGRGIEINVYAPEGSKVSHDSQTVGDREQINIMIDEAVAGSVQDSKSRTYKALKNSFGLKQTLTTR